MLGDERKRRFRDPERTRERLRKRLFGRSADQVSRVPASIQILAATNVTKGALYHHFESKEALGYAIVDEIVAKLVRDRWLSPLLGNGEPIDVLIGIVQRMPGPARRRSRKLSTAQFGTRDVFARRAIPQATGEAIPGLAGRCCYAFAERAVRRNGFAVT
jgi:AcrR family transcriptional regulator